MLVTVTDETGVSTDTINWCGKTWDFSAGDSGKTKCVCPTFYNLTPYVTGTVATLDGVKTNKAASHTWTIAGLGLRRDFQLFYEFGFAVFNDGINVLHILSSPTISDRKVWNWLESTAASSTFSLNLINAVGKPVATDYQITGAFFGNHSVGNVNYKWARGNDW